VPVTTIVTADEPTGTSFGETDVMARGVTTGVVLPPTPEDDPEVAGAEAHPESRIRRRQKDAPRRKKPKGLEKKIFMIENGEYPTVC